MIRRTLSSIIIFLFLLNVFTLYDPNLKHNLADTDNILVPVLNSPNTTFNSTIPDFVDDLSFKLQSFQSPAVLFLVGDDTALDAIHDIAFYDYMTVDLGFNVTYHTANDSYNINSYDVVVISRSVAEEGTVETLSTASIPILTMEPGHGDDFGLGAPTKYYHKWDTNVELLPVSHYILEDHIPESSVEVYTPAWEDLTYLKDYNKLPAGCDILQLAYLARTDYAAIAVLEKNGQDWFNTSSPERRIFWGIPETDRFNVDTWNWYKKALFWILYDDIPGNATLNVNVKDLDGYNIENALVNLTDTMNSSNTWIQNTTITGQVRFSNIPWGKYNLTVNYRTIVNDTYANLAIVPTRTYMKTMSYDYSIVIDKFIDEEPPEILDITFNRTSLTFFADVADFSNLSYVHLNLTAYNHTSNDDEINSSQPFTMILYSGITYHNQTALDTLSNLINITISYNILAEDTAGNFIASPLRHINLDDPDDPIIWSYLAFEYGNSTVKFVVNATDESGIQPPIILQVNSEYYEMYQDSSCLWIYRGLFDYGIELNYTVYSVFDQVGNENGSRQWPVLFPLKNITPSDTVSPRISALSDTFSNHDEGYVEFDVNIDDWNPHQSGVNGSNVQLILEINGVNDTRNMTQIGEITFTYQDTFDYNDSIKYWVKAVDIANNFVYSSGRGPFSINDNTIPNIAFWAFEYGNGTLDFYSNVNDWPNNDTIAYILFTDDYFAVDWMNFSMIQMSETLYWYRYPNFPYQTQDVWYYATAVDAANNSIESPLDTAKSLSLSDSIAPEITLTLINSTTNDGEVTVQARAVDPYGEQIFVNNTFYINISSLSGSFSGTMTYDPAFYPFSTYSHTFSYPYQEEVTFTVWVNDLGGNQGIINKSILSQDVAPPSIVGYGITEFQNGTLIIWTEVRDGNNGSGLLMDNSSVLLNWAFIHEISVNMEWNSTGNFFCYKIDGREPRDAITYNITVYDNAQNIASTGLLLYKITDETPPIFLSNPSYNETQINHISTEVIFSTVAQDPFGEISEVLLEYAILEDSQWLNYSTTMIQADERYEFKLTLIPNTTLQYRIIVIDEWFNNVTSSYSMVQLKDFSPATFDEDLYGIEIMDSDSGRIKVWVTVRDIFDHQEENVSLTIIDLNTSTVIFENVTMNKEGRNHSMIVSVEYHHDYSFTLILVDLGVFYGYYNAEILAIPNLHIDDQWSPEFHSVGYESLNSTEIRFWARVTDWGTGIHNVTLYYSLDAGKGSQFDDGYELVLMINNGTHYIGHLSIKTSGILYWNIVAFDGTSFSVYNGPTEGTTIIAGGNGLSGIPLETLVLVGIGVLIVVSVFGSITLSVRRRRRIAKQFKQSLQDKLSFLSNTYTILVSSSAGVPILTTTNIIYQSSDSMNGALSGLSVGIDSFLASFQSDFMTQIQSNPEFRPPQQPGDVKVSLIEQNEVQILILGSETYRIFVFLREIPNEFIRTSFVKISSDLERKLQLTDLGIVDEAIMAPQVQNIMRKHLPIDLLRPFQIDLLRVKEIERTLAKNVDKFPISKDALRAIKILVVTAFSRPSSAKSVKSLLKQCDKHISETSQRFTGFTFYSNAKTIISRFVDFPIELEYDTFWNGIDEKVQILVPQNEG